MLVFRCGRPHCLADGPCQESCDADAVCLAWTFYTLVAGGRSVTRCCLKSAVPVPRKETDPNITSIISGVKDPGSGRPNRTDPLHNGCPMMANHSACRPTETLQLAASERFVSLRLFVDQTFAEAYWQRGRVVQTVSVPGSQVASAALAADANVTAASIDAWAVNPIWATPAEIIATPRVPRS